ncbi:MAG: ATP-binding protein [Pseudomonadota bacterium]
MELTDRLAEERRARLAAERLLDLKSRELFEANRKLSQHALSLSEQVVEHRGANEELKTQAEKVRADLHRAEEHVQIIERRLWDSVETITDGFAVFDAEDKLIAANTAWLSMFGFSKRIGPGTLYLEVLRIAVDEGHVDIGEERPGVWIGTMLERWDASEVEKVTIRMSNGQWFRLIDRRSRDGDMVCLAQNVTTLKEREAELEEARHRAEAANRAKSAFLANMSHELRTPMNGVVGMAEMLLDSELEDEQALYVSTIKSSGEALLQIINHILDFSKMEAERMVLRPEPFDLERLVHEVLMLVSPVARDKSLALHVDYDLFLPTRVIGDTGRIRQILTNLVGNAVKFTQEGHILIRVVGFDAGAAGWQLHVTVEDTGIGIPPDMLDHIFGSFAQVEDEKNRSFEGTGLGLAITKELVTLMGGEIWVESEPENGSCFGFRMTLPTAEPTRREPETGEVGEARALVVGVEGLDADIMCRRLEQLGVKVEVALSGSDGLKRALLFPRPQIVVADETLPDTSGPDLCRALADAGSRAARLIVCATPHDAARLPPADSGAAHGVISRPVSRSQLFEALVRLPELAIDAPPPDESAPDLASVEATEGSVRSDAEGREVAAPKVDPVPGAAPQAAGRGPRRMRVLAAEDNKTNRFVLGKMLRNLDIELHFAENGVEAVEMFADLAPDLVFMDISMPKMDGKAATRVIRGMEAAAGQGGAPGHVPIVAMTAHALEGDREEILRAGIDHYLTKPLKRAFLEEQVLQNCPADCLPPQAVNEVQAKAG